MNSGDLTDIFRAKECRRRELAALPFGEKIRQIEALHAVGMELRKLRPRIRSTGLKRRGSDASA